MKKMRFIFDIDDVLMPYLSIVVDELETMGIFIDMEDITTWNFTNFPPEIQSVMMELTHSEAIHKRQAPYEGAVEMLQSLVNEGHDVGIASAIRPELANLRLAQIHKFFPMVPDNNIILSNRKDVIECDFMLDDALHNIESSRAKFPVLFRKPWNTEKTTGYIVDSYESFMQMVKNICSDSAPTNKIIALTGPSASGKSFIAAELAKYTQHEVVRTSTSRPKREQENSDAYYYLSREEFECDIKHGDFVEYTEYNGNYYGSSLSAIHDIWSRGHIAVVVVDIAGVRSFVDRFGDSVASIFVNRDKKAILKAILERSVSIDDKVSRIISLDDEYKNRLYCRYSIDNNSTVENAVNQINKIIDTQLQFQVA